MRIIDILVALFVIVCGFTAIGTGIYVMWQESR